MTLCFKPFSYVIIALTLFNVAYSQDYEEYTIKHINVKDGLSQSSIISILQDRVGFMWFATGSGLNRYDGYSIKAYFNDPKDSFTISDNGISALFEDKHGNIWVGTTGGFVNCFDRKSDTF